MKINEYEIEAAREVMDRHGYTLVSSMALNEAIHAAYRVRKARKAAKREKGKPIDMDEMLRVHAEWDKQVETGMNLSDTNSSVGNTTAPKPLTIEAGKSYRTRDGQKAVVTYAEEKWEEYASAHNCKQFGYISPSSGTGIGFDGKVTLITIPSKTGYRCDNGQEFWR